MDKKLPLCTAPWTNILIDTNKGVKPCCSYEDVHIGNIYSNQAVISDIINSPGWQDLKNKLLNGQWPKGCYKGCKQREDFSGWSQRLNFLPVNDYSDYASGKIIYMEFNGSNICNLACLHCNPNFSSKWVEDWDKLTDPNLKYFNFELKRSYLPNKDIVFQNIQLLDLSNLKYVHFKGGDPMLNEETLGILEHLQDIEVLSNISITMFSNGTFINDKILNLLGKAKKVTMMISIDGIGKLNEYIRYGNDNITNTDNIEENIKKYSNISNIEFGLSVSTMVYNVFNLIDIRDYWLGLKQKYKFTSEPFFNIVVTYPDFLNPCVLSDQTRKELVDFYTKNKIGNEFNTVIKSLTNNYVGDVIHNKWVDYTMAMEKIRHNSIVDLVPQLKEELKYR